MKAKHIRACIECGAGLSPKSNGKRCPSCSMTKQDTDRAASRRRAAAKKVKP